MGFHYLDYFFNKMIGFKKAKKTTLENYIPKIIKEFSAYLKK
jgi:hypothetical protein